MSNGVEKQLGNLAAVLGESPESTAAVSILRDLMRGAGEADAAYCLVRIQYAIERAIEAARVKAYDEGYDDAQIDGDPGPDESMDGDAASALSSVYGENE